MKKIIAKIKKQLHNNQGSSLVLVIVSLAFIGILMGALLTASMAVYKLKLYDYNAKDNFYYVEQGMDEIYAGIGSKTVENLQRAYGDTLENVIKYDPVKKEYTTMDNDEANAFFKDTFMNYLIGDSTFTLASMGDSLAGFISNPDVELVKENLGIAYYDVDGNSTPVPDPTNLGKIVLKNVTLRRSVNYDRSQASGQFSQTISTDIVIGRPDYNVNFDATAPSVNNLFDFCLIADSGVEFNETPGNAIAVSGNVYAASDFYNKRYNRYPNSFAVSGDPYSASDDDFADAEKNDLTYEIGDKTYSIDMNPVSNYTYTTDTLTTLYNMNDAVRNPGKQAALLRYDGKNERSMYSGFYVDNNRVSLIAGRLIVPGTIAVMNTGDLSVYGVNKSSSGAGSLTTVWADNIVLGGYTNNETKAGSSILLNANVFMKDDTSIETDGTKFKLVGSYYGYSDGNKKDVREFVPTIAKDKDGKAIYQEENDSGETFTRGHYNSSAFVVNGERAEIDFSNAKNIYLAGRSYIELSRQKTKSELKEEQEVNGTDIKYDIKDEAYQFDTEIKDYKTGESFAVSSGQFAYLPYEAPTPVYKTVNGVPTAEIDHWESKLPVALQHAELFVKYFGAKDSNCPTVPVLRQTEKITMANGTERNKTYYYLDFDYAAREELYDTVKFGSLGSTADAAKDMADVLRTSFIRDYYYYLNFADGYQDGLITYNVATGSVTYKGKTYPDVDVDVLVDEELTNILTQIADDEAFEAGEIKLPSTIAGASMYASGTIADTLVTTTTTDKEITYNVTTGDSTINSTLLTEEGVQSSNNTSTAAKAKAFSEEYAKHYNYVKFTLGDVPENDPVAQFIDTKLVNATSKYGEASLTPLNYYLNMNMIKEDTDINMTVGAGYKVVINGGDVRLKCDGGEMTGIVVAKGDVYLDNITGDDADKSIKKFNGIIITGGKVYVNGDVSTISSSVFCKKIMSLCADLSKNGTGTDKTNADFVLKLFKGYEDYVADPDGSIETDVKYVSISNLDYSDVVRYDNWKKNVD